jgi:hypothetical protein
MEIRWSHGDCFPVMATMLAPDELSQRCGSPVFRDRDDLDWFSGIVVRETSIGPILVMKHDNNPQQLTVFYVDAGLDAVTAQKEVSEVFALELGEIAWRPESQ